MTLPTEGEIREAPNDCERSARRVFAAGRIPSEKRVRRAKRTEVECGCGYLGILMDVQWWEMLGRFIGTCPRCLHSPCFEVQP